MVSSSVFWDTCEEKVQKHETFQKDVLLDLGRLQQVLVSVQQLQGRQAENLRVSKEEHARALAAVKEKDEQIALLQAQQQHARQEQLQQQEQQAARIRELEGSVVEKDAIIAALREQVAANEVKWQKAIVFEEQDRMRHCQVIDELWAALEVAHGSVKLHMSQRDSLVDQLLCEDDDSDGEMDTTVGEVNVQEQQQQEQQQQQLVEEKTKELEKKSEEISSLLVENKRLQGELSDSLGQLAVEKETSAARLKILRAKIVQLEGAAVATSAIEQQLKQQNNDQKLQIDTIGEELATARRLLAEASQQTAKLEDNDEYKILLEDAQSRIEQLGKDFEHAKAQLVQARQAFALLQSQLQDAIAQKTQTEQDLQVLAKDRERIFTFLEEYKQSTGEKIEVLQENLDKAEFEVEALDKLLDHVRAVLETGPSSEALAELLWELDDDNEDTPDASQ